MRRSYIGLYLLLLILPGQARALMQLQFNFSYDKTIYGDDRQNKLVKRTYSGSYAWFLFSTTALEFNYMEETQINTYNEIQDDGGPIRVLSQQSTVRVRVYGVGIRQALMPLKGSIIPMISAGYAKQFTTSGTDYTIDNSGVVSFLHFTDEKKRYDSAFGAFILNIKISELFTLSGSVKTVFRAFEWNEAKDNIKYLAGFSWFF